ncbi:MAG: AbrB/MazE/SpoVT family DNA-binding domain-containing protein [Thermofilum sp.]|jgi:AbrB family looped-hinge helix DNA binding protein|nr:AbrB/MazE/SpoVT family DNA-binding domain-containing protein [Thermofilum sp.]
MMDGRIIRVSKKGVIVIPVEVREVLGIKEGDLLTLELIDDTMVIKPLRPLRVKLGGKAQEIVREAKREELELEEGLRSGY